MPVEPVRSLLPSSVVATVLNETGSEYVYTTVAGNYSFPKDKPYLMKYETAEGEVLVNASTFVVLSPGIALFTSVVVLNATDSFYRVRYDFTVGLASGDVTISYVFRDNGPPKVAAERHGQLTLPLIWVTHTLDSVVFNDSYALDFASLDEPVDVTPADLSLTIGPTEDPLNWTRRMSLDWSDAGAGTAYAGPFSAGSLAGPAVFVVFSAPAVATCGYVRLDIFGGDGLFHPTEDLLFWRPVLGVLVRRSEHRVRERTVQLRQRTTKRAHVDGQADCAIRQSPERYRLSRIRC